MNGIETIMKHGNLDNILIHIPHIHIYTHTHIFTHTHINTYTHTYTIILKGTKWLMK